MKLQYRYLDKCSALRSLYYLLVRLRLGMDHFGTCVSSSFCERSAYFFDFPNTFVPSHSLDSQMTRGTQDAKTLSETSGYC